MSLFSGLTGGAFRMPDSAINYGNVPLPSIPPGATQFTTADGRYNATSSLLPGGLESPYAYGISARASTQTQMAYPNRVQLIIPKLYIPAPESDGVDPTDPVLQHAISDGDFVFSFQMGSMAAYGSQYCEAPYGHAAKAVQLVNLATVNYLLWGLQVGLRGPKASRWRAFFNNLTKTGIRASTALDETAVWNFIKTYFRPFGVQHGGDQQGGRHEVDGGSIVTHGAVDYVSSFAIEGKLRHVNNLWRDHDVRENDDLVLALRHKAPPHGELPFVLSSSVRATRNERVAVTSGFYYLRPEVLQYRSFSDVPFIHVGRSMLYCSAYTRGVESCCWNARMPVTPGAPLLLTFEPVFVDSDRMHFAAWEIEDGADGVQPRQGERTTAEEDIARQQAAAAAAEVTSIAPPHVLVRPPPATAAAPPATAAAMPRTGARAPAPAGNNNTNNNRPAAGGAPSAKKQRTVATGASAAPAATGASASSSVFAMLSGGQRPAAPPAGGDDTNNDSSSGEDA